MSDCLMPSDRRINAIRRKADVESMQRLLRYLRTMPTLLSSIDNAQRWTLSPVQILQRWVVTTSAIRMPVVSFPLAQTGEGIAECEVIKWLVKEGDKIQQFDKVCEVQSDKASVEISSPYEGIVKHLPHRPGDVVKVGSTLMEIEVPEGIPVTDIQTTVDVPSASTNITSPTREKTERVQASPTVRLFARELDVRLSDVLSTGPGGRILKQDILNYLNRQSKPGDVTVERLTEQKIPIRGYKRSMLKTMTAALSIPHFHFCDDVDMTSMLALKQRLDAEFAFGGLKVAFLPIFIKALSAALKEFPIVNSSLSHDHSEVIVHRGHHVGVAVATDDGLVVPVIKNVQDKTIVQIAHEMEELKKDALTNTCQPEDLSDATITVSNVGTVGGIYSSPLITPPQLSIVALGRMRSVVKMESGDIQKRPMMPISWGADHRVLDGATLVNFSNRWKHFLEHPDVLTLFLK